MRAIGGTFHQMFLPCVPNHFNHCGDERCPGLRCVCVVFLGFRCVNCERFGYFNSEPFSLNMSAQSFHLEEVTLQIETLIASPRIGKVHRISNLWGFISEKTIIEQRFRNSIVFQHKFMIFRNQKLILNCNFHILKNEKTEPGHKFSFNSEKVCPG
jgi:hypothetical protein